MVSSLFSRHRKITIMVYLGDVYQPLLEAVIRQKSWGKLRSDQVEKKMNAPKLLLKINYDDSAARRKHGSPKCWQL